MNDHSRIRLDSMTCTFTYFNSCVTYMSMYDFIDRVPFVFVLFVLFGDKFTFCNFMELTICV
jgi:hypothetical protein